MTKPFKKIAASILNIFWEATTNGIASTFAALFFLYFFGIGGLYIMARNYITQQDYVLSFEERNKLNESYDNQFWIYTIMLIFNICMFSLTVYLFLKFTN